MRSALNCILRDKIDGLLKTLTYREREIIRLRYGLGDGYTYTLEEVGRIFKVTRERVRQIEAKAVRKLQNPVRSAHLEGFVPEDFSNELVKEQKEQESSSVDNPTPATSVDAYASVDKPVLETEEVPFWQIPTEQSTEEQTTFSLFEDSVRS